MKDKMIDAEKIRLGRMTYFDANQRGSAVSPIDTYVFMVNTNGVYVNPFDLTMELPIFDRVPYSNFTRDGEAYGTKIKLVQGELESGPCIVLDRVDVGKHYGKEKISVDMLEEYMLSSDKFFIDRIDFYENMETKKNIFWALDNRLATIRQRDVQTKYFEDKEKLDKFNEFMDSCREDSMHFSR